MRKRLSLFRSLRGQDLKRFFIVALSSTIVTLILSAKTGFFLDVQEASSTGYRLYLKQQIEGDLDTGDLIAFQANGRVFFGHNQGAMVAKYIVGKPGDHVVIENEVVFINGQNAGQINPGIYEVFHKPAHAFDADYRLQEDEYFVMGTAARSFDSRYWGPIKRSWISSRLISVL